MALAGACAGRPAAPPPAPPAGFLGDPLPLPDISESRGGTVRVALDAEPTTLNYQLDPPDPSARTIGALIYESLASPDPLTWRLRPRLAERWTQDGNAWVFYLRPEAVWQDGRPVSADDVVYTFTKLRDPGALAPTARSLLAQSGRPVKVNARTVRFEGADRSPHTLRTIAETAIYPRHVFAGGDFAHHPAGRRPLAAGPYRVESWIPGGRIVLRPNERYFGTRPANDRLEFVFLAPSEQLSAAMGGAVDVVPQLPLSAWADVLDPNVARAFLRLRHVPSGLQAIAWNHRRAPFAKVEVRRALSALIDRQSLIQAVRAGVALPAASWFYPDSAEYNRALLPPAFDPNGATAVASKPPSLALLYPQSALYAELAARVAIGLGKGGVSTRLQPEPWPSYTAALAAGDFDAALMTWHVTPGLDPRPTWASYGVLNFAGYQSAAVDALLRQAEDGSDAERAELYRGLSARLAREQPYALLYFRYTLSLVSRRLTHVRSTPFGIFDYAALSRRPS